MKKEKGFTLIELLAVIVIISVIAAIVFPVVTKHIQNSKQKAYDIQINEIIRAAKDWALDNSDKLDKYHINPTYVSIVELQSATNVNGETYLSSGEIKNPLTGERMSGTIIIDYDLEHNQYDYRYEEVDKSELEKNKVVSAVETILDNVTLASTSNSEGLYDDSSQNKYIYKGKAPLNYLNIDGTLWRIISIDKDTYQMKAIKTTHTTKNSWAGTTSPTSYVFGDNNLDIYNYLNKDFYNNNAALQKIIVTNSKWNNGEVSNQNNSLNLARTLSASSTVKANIGLLSIDEYLSAAVDPNIKACKSNFKDVTCKNSNYLAFTSGYWLINTAGTNQIWSASTNGIAPIAPTNTDMIAMPVITIKSSVTLEAITNKENIGSSSNPFVLKLS